MGNYNLQHQKNDHPSSLKNSDCKYIYIYIYVHIYIFEKQHQISQDSVEIQALLQKDFAQCIVTFSSSETRFAKMLALKPKDYASTWALTVMPAKDNVWTKAQFVNEGMLQFKPPTEFLDVTAGSENKARLGFMWIAMGTSAVRP